MTSVRLTNDGWPATVERLGGQVRLELEGREAGAFRRAREIECAVDCLRLVLAYCLGALGLRLTVARAEALGIASISNVALLKRVRKALPWLERLVARQLALQSPGERTIAAAHGRLVAIRRPNAAREQAIEAARRKAKKNCATIRPQTLIAAEWMILVTSLPKETFSLQDISALYRLRWRIEIAFKHLKSGAGLRPPPAETVAMAKAYVLAHLLLILLTEPLIAEHLGLSPRREAA